ncbi:hypothetical protein K435DRAFT_798640 [Dendrothele bispora CBS 962.96]|uniref:Uncharacterized protein n=1 Tax=Dendrothele bispora (strain CBS 962.96) TaxID=1314807 RepID=A0A4S8LZ61_DENBC|nr:hypothetical protein K435DRAFT_798640 [Dendrothele bispora CBS 962.96]
MGNLHNTKYRRKHKKKPSVNQWQSLSTANATRLQRQGHSEEEKGNISPSPSLLLTQTPDELHSQTPISKLQTVYKGRNHDSETRKKLTLESAKRQCPSGVHFGRSSGKRGNGLIRSEKAVTLLFIYLSEIKSVRGCERAAKRQVQRLKKVKKALVDENHKLKMEIKAKDKRIYSLETQLKRRNCEFQVERKKLLEKIAEGKQSAYLYSAQRQDLLRTGTCPWTVK